MAQVLVLGMALAGLVQCIVVGCRREDRLSLFFLLATAQVEYLSFDPVPLVCLRCVMASYLSCNVLSSVRRSTFAFSPRPINVIRLLTAEAAHPVLDPEFIIFPARFISD